MVNAPSRGTLEPENPETLTAEPSLAHIHMKRNWLAEAQELPTKVMDPREKVFGEEHTSTLDASENLTFLQDQQGRYDEVKVSLVPDREYVQFTVEVVDVADHSRPSS